MPQFAKVFSLRMLQLSFGASLEGLSPVQLGLSKPVAIHDIFEGYNRKNGLPSFRVRLCRKCNGTSERLDKGTYETLEDACLVHDVWQLTYGNSDMSHALIPGDEQWIALLSVRKLARKMQHVIALSAAAKPSEESSEGEENCLPKRKAPEDPVPLTVTTRNGFNRILRQYTFIEIAFVRSLIGNDVPLMSSLQALAASGQQEQHRKSSRSSYELVPTESSPQRLSKAAVTALQAQLLQFALFASYEIPPEAVLRTVAAVEDLAPVSHDDTNLVTELSTLLTFPKQPCSDECVFRVQILVAFIGRHIAERSTFTLQPYRSQTDYFDLPLWQTVDTYHAIFNDVYRLFDHVCFLVIRIQSESDSVLPHQADALFRMLNSALYTILLYLTSLVSYLLYFSPCLVTTECLRKMVDGMTRHHELFPVHNPAMRRILQEGKLNAVIAQLELHDRAIDLEQKLVEADALVLSIVSYRATQHGPLGRSAAWLDESLAETELIGLAAILSYTCFRPLHPQDALDTPLPEEVTPDTVYEMTNSCLQADLLDENWFYPAFLTFFPGITVDATLQELAGALAEYSSFARENQVGFLTSSGLAVISYIFRLARHHCASSAFAPEVCKHCALIMDLNSSRFKLTKLLGHLIHQPMYSTPTRSDGMIVCPNTLCTSVGDVFNEIYQDPWFDQFFALLPPENVSF